MTFGDWLESQRQQLSDDAIAKKDSQAALFDLLALFEHFPPDQRREAEHIVATWLESSDEGKRFDAAFLVNESEPCDSRLVPAEDPIPSRLQLVEQLLLHRERVSV
jgi:hypothetical protein